MGVRFNKRITLFPWLRANVGKSGISLSIGPKGKTLNVGSTGVNVNVSLGKGVGYNKRLITWKKFNPLHWFGIGSDATTKTSKSKTKNAVKKGKKGTTAPTGELSLDDAIAEAEAANNPVTTPNDAPVENSQQEQTGCSWGCAILGLFVILVLLAVVVFLLWQLYGGTLQL